MIEILSIYSQLIIFLIIFQFPLNKIILNSFGYTESNYFNILIYNIIIQSFCYLIISFISFNIKLFLFSNLCRIIIFNI